MTTTNKTILALTILLGTTFFESKATVLTVSNSTLNAGQYSSLQTAINAAANGDTIYVTGSPFSYGDVKIDRKLCLIGAGYAITGTQNNLRTTLGNIFFGSNGTLGTDQSGSSFIGLFLGTINYYSLAGSNIYLSRCYFTTANIGGNGWLIENNIITNLGFISFNLSSCMVRNNYFLSGGNIYSNNAALDHSGLTLIHNIIGCKLSNLNNATVNNNVFFYSDISAWGGVNTCIFTNNITASSVSSILPYGTNTGTGNINDVPFANLFAGGVSTSQAFPAVLSIDWHLLPASPGHNAATDGTDIGIYGGTMPMPNWTGASSLIPQMTLLDIQNSDVPVNGNLNVRFKARKQD